MQTLVMRLAHVRFDPDFAAAPRREGTRVSAAVAAALALVFWVDRITMSAPLQHLYYLPIILANLRLGRGGGFITSVASVVLYHLANPALITSGYRESDVVQIVLFIAVGVVTARLSDDARRLRQLAATDDLTGLHNLRSFESRLGALLRAARAAHAPLAMLVLDLDRLKILNDMHGHLAGAEAVRTVGRILATRLPPDAVACRYGGDEFAVVLPGRTSDEASAIADGLRRFVATVAPVLGGVSFATGTLSVSVGVAVLAPPRTDPEGVSHEGDAGEALFKAADRALYDAKHAGRNRVAVAS
jgi:diguanylate cyclase (GGDEF)-like protein